MCGSPFRTTMPSNSSSTARRLSPCISVAKRAARSRARSSVIRSRPRYRARWLQSLYRLGFDPAFSSTAQVDYALGIPLTHLGVRAPIVPIFVNAYLPPQPSIERCYAFGQAVATALGALGVRAVVVASGGMSHFPGTERYANPDLDFDRALLEPLARGNLKALIGLGEAQLDASGNIELRCWAVAAGMLGERKPDVLELNPSWHHNYASLGFWSKPPCSSRISLSGHETGARRAHRGAARPGQRCNRALGVREGAGRVHRALAGRGCAGRAR